MTHVDGYKTIKRIRQMFNSIGIPFAHQPKIVAVTCLTEERYVKKALSSGIDEIIAKPVQMERFASLLMEQSLITEIPNYLKQHGFDQ